MSTFATPSPSPTILILAAGFGKRMQSPLPKVLQPMAGKPLLFHLLDRVLEATPESPIGIVVGYEAELVESTVRAAYGDAQIEFINQPDPRGTGHAAQCAMNSSWGEKIRAKKLPVLVLPGDTPLLQSQMILELIQPLGKSAALRLLTCHFCAPTGYGRVVRRGRKVQKIVEERDASPRERQITEVAVSIYFFQSAFLSASLSKLSDKNALGEYYLTDLIGHASRAKREIDVLTWENAEDLTGINDPWELSQAARIFNTRCVKAWAKKGVRFLDPATTWIESQVELSAGVVIHPNVQLGGRTQIKPHAVIEAGCHLRNAEIGEKVHLKQGCVVEDSKIGAEASVGPYAHLRPESVVGPKAKIGNFVELKKSRIGASTSIAHLSYLGDAVVGERVNIGCGFVTCNFDGRVINGQRKHATIIEDDVFLGSDCQAIAPIRIGKGAYVASGSTLTQNVEAGALAVARSRQVNKPGYAARLKELSLEAAKGKI